eukprot:m.189952 g.189952  ORF g.189952 m.189952 type:complete len:746 (+) comp17556_c1_seq4:271-2508(+)
MEVDMDIESPPPPASAAAATTTATQPNGNGSSNAVEEDDSHVQRLPFEEVTDNVFLCERRRSKEKMECECTFNPAVDAVGCGEDCLNRQLFYECIPSRCACGKYCTNCQFQKKTYASVEVFEAGKKGRGLRALQDIARGQFIYEYCGEVYDLAEFEHRTQVYAHEGRKHFYFMSLDSDHIVDATMRGSISRFINHSCDPNAETQKWTVLGETRVGFFAIKPIKAGEEITFDYKYERYGEKAQPCYCMSKNCRGTLGGSKDTDSKRRSSMGMSASKRRRVADAALAELEEKMTPCLNEQGGLRNNAAVLELMRHATMASDPMQRMYLLSILQSTTSEDVLLVALQFRLLYIMRLWLGESTEDAIFTRRIMMLLKSLPIRVKNPIKSSKIDETIESLQRSDDELVAEEARALIAAWSPLKEVYVIPKASRSAESENDAASLKQEIPRDRRSDFTKTRLQEFEQSSKCRLVFSEERTADDNYILLIYGSDSDRCRRGQDAVMAFLKRPVSPRRMSSNQKNNKPVQPMKRTLSGTLIEPQPAASQGSNSPVVQAPPAPVSDLPPGWAMALAENGTPYYYHQLTMETSWEKPAKVSAAALVAQKLLQQPNKTAIAGVGLAQTVAELQERTAGILPSVPSTSAVAQPVAEESKSAKGMDALRELKEKIGAVVVEVLNRYRQPECKVGRITSQDDFKYLARKLSHAVIEKEMKRNGGNFDFTDDVKHKAKNFVKEYMKKFGETYVRTDKDKE